MCFANPSQRKITKRLENTNMSFLLLSIQLGTAPLSELLVRNLHHWTIFYLTFNGKINHDTKDPLKDKKQKRYRVCKGLDVQLLKISYMKSRSEL